MATPGGGLLAHPLLPLVVIAGLVLLVLASCICTGEGRTILGSKRGVYVPERQQLVSKQVHTIYKCWHTRTMGLPRRGRCRIYVSGWWLLDSELGARLIRPSIISSTRRLLLMQGRRRWLLGIPIHAGIRIAKLIRRTTSISELVRILGKCGLRLHPGLLGDRPIGLIPRVVLGLLKLLILRFLFWSVGSRFSTARHLDEAGSG
jgi:hypothetical protein